MATPGPTPTEYCFVFIAANSRGRLQIDTTDNLPLAMRWLKAGAYNRRCRLKHIDRLVLFEAFPTFAEAAARFDELRQLNRRRINLLIAETNPLREDLSAQWFPVLAADRRADDEPDGGVLACLPQRPVSRGPGYEQTWPDSEGPELIPVHC